MDRTAVKEEILKSMNKVHQILEKKDSGSLQKDMNYKAPPAMSNPSPATKKIRLPIIMKT